jgi:HTH-type transcriptional regulator/antitoxin HipB
MTGQEVNRMTVVTDCAEWGTALRDARRAKGWTQAELARRMGVGRKWVISAEAGSPTAHVDLFLTACAYLDILVDLVPDPTAQSREAIIDPSGTGPFRLPDVQEEHR